MFVKYLYVYLHLKKMTNKSEFESNHCRRKNTVDENHPWWIILYTCFATFLTTFVFIPIYRYIIINLNFVAQEDVPYRPGVVHGIAGGPAVRCAHGHRTGGQQAVPLRVPPVFVAGGRQGRPACPTQAVHAPWLAVYWRSAAQAGRFLREGQAHQ